MFLLLLLPLCTLRELDEIPQWSSPRDREGSKISFRVLPFLTGLYETKKSNYGAKLKMIDNSVAMAGFYSRRSTIDKFIIILKLRISAEPPKRFFLNRVQLKIILWGRL